LINTQERPEVRSGRASAHLFLFGTIKDKQKAGDLKAKPRPF